MIKRSVIGFLWTFALYAGWKLAAGIVGAPQYLDLLAMVASATLGGVVAWRSVPTSSGPERRIAQIPDRALPDGTTAQDPRA